MSNLKLRLLKLKTPNPLEVNLLQLVSITQFRNLEIFLPNKFNVKSIYMSFEGQIVLFLTLSAPMNFGFSGFLHSDRAEIYGK